MKNRMFWILGVAGVLTAPPAQAVLTSSSVSYRASAGVSDSTDPTNIFDLELFEASYSGSAPFNVTADVGIPGGTAQADLNAVLTPTTLRAHGRAQFSVGGEVGGGASNRWEFNFRLENPALLDITGSASAITPPVGGGLSFRFEKRLPTQILASGFSGNSLDYGAIWGGPRQLEPGSYRATFSGGTNSQRSGGTLILASGFADIDALLVFTPLGGSPDGDYSGDGFVSQADLDLVLLNWGNTTAPGGFDPDAVPGGGPFDGLISQNELDGVLLNWGDGTPPTASAIPEPASLTLLALSGIFVATRRDRRPQHR